MKILIVHDRPEMASALSSIVEEVNDSRGAICVEADYHGARRSLSNTIYDLLIIDLTIPISRRSGAAGFEPVEQLLNELFTMDTLNVPGDVIGITKDLSALDRIDVSLGPHLMVAIEEDREGRWRSYVRDKVIYAKRAAQTRYISINQHYDYDALIITAVDREMQPYFDMFELSDVKHFPGARQFLFSDGKGQLRRGIMFSIGRSGQAPAASFTQALITFFRPRLVLMSGYCGGVRGKVALGDLVFFEASYAWDYGKWSEEGEPSTSVFRARPNPIGIEGGIAHQRARAYLMSDFNREPALLRAVDKESRGRLERFAMHLGPAGSGSAVVANDPIISQIRGLSDSLCAVDMESYGFYHAALNTRVVAPAALCVKAVSDFCNGEKEDGLHGVCSLISASLVCDMLTKTWDFS